jgi:large subunit ribosomal protein L9
MKVILTANVPKVGRQYEVKEVADGFGRNFLLARGQAILATPEALKKLAQERERDAAAAAQSAEEWEKIFKTLATTELKITAKASEQGHLFAGLHAEKLSAELKKQVGLNIPAAYLVLPEGAVKKTGEQPVIVRVGEREASFKLRVERL